MKEFFSPFRAETTPTGGKDQCRIYHWRERWRHTLEGVRWLFGWCGQIQILRQAQSSWISCYTWPICIEWLPECYATVAACWVRPHFLLLHRVPWSLHTTGAAPMEDHLVHSSDHLVHSSDCALIQSCKHYLAPVWSSITTTCAINLAENVTVHFFPLLARTCARKGVKTMAIRCRRYPLKMKKPCCKLLRTFSTSCWGEHITYSWQWREDCKKKENCSFRMTLISLGPTKNIHINTESLLNKQLYSNQDVIYREQAATFLWERKSMHAYSYSKEMRMSDFSVFIALVLIFCKALS